MSASGIVRSFGDLVKLALAQLREHGVSPEREVLLVLRHLLAAGVGVDVEEVVPDTLFPEGLKIY
jgi:hypothetical protein